MPSLTAAEIGKNIKNGEVSSLYYFYGHDTAALESFTLRLIKRLCPDDAQFMNYHKLDGKKLDISELNDACSALPMFADRVVVSINDLNMDDVNKADTDDIKAILSALDETTAVIIYSTGVNLYKSNNKYLTDKNKAFCTFCEKNGVASDFAYKRANELGKSVTAYLAKRNCTISRANAEYLANLCLCDSGAVTRELEKLSAYAEGREVTREDIDELCIKRIESDGYALALRMLRGDAAFVFKRVRELDVQNYKAHEILGIISFSLTDIYRAKLARASGLDWQSAAKDFGYPRNREFAIKNAFSECGSFSAARIRETLKILYDTDIMLKTRSSGREGDLLTLEQGLARSMALQC
ncbi:MAG: DNA polymerase III subunit delta [Ruminococcus sp.]|nr:DNA polymerase III subunit delta [Ruminococcus sp.]